MCRHAAMTFFGPPIQRLWPLGWSNSYQGTSITSVPVARRALAAAVMMRSCEPEAIAAAVVVGAADQASSGMRPAAASGATRLAQPVNVHGM